MSTTKPDLRVTNSAWVDVLAESDIDPLSSITLFNKSGSNVLVAFGETPPTSATAGELLTSYNLPFARKSITGEGKVWLRSSSRDAVVSVTINSDIPVSVYLYSDDDESIVLTAEDGITPLEQD